MPIYEYEPLDHDCLICMGRNEVMQSIQDAPLNYCPTCGLGVRRVISQAAFKVQKLSDPDKAAAKGFTSFKRVEKGKWEKVSGEGPDMIVGTKEDIAAVENESSGPKKIIDLDS